MLPYLHKNILEVGIDEAGRGPLIGNVYTSGVIWPQDINFESYAMILNDSKKISKRKRLILKDYIEEYAIDYSISFADNFTIDNKNILNATLYSMHNAIDNLNVQPEFIIVDGNRFNTYKNNSGAIIPHQCIIGGDAIYDSIAAASILAKVYHDQHIKDLCNEFPELDEYYDLSHNMGYGTTKHLAGIKKYGISKFHRKSFAPCKNL